MPCIHGESSDAVAVKVLVRFKGDNDFAHVMKVFGDLLLLKVQRGSREVTPSNVARWFNQVALTLHELQSYSLTPEVRDTLSTYLRINAEDVFINEAVAEKMKTAEQWMNHDSVVVDCSEYARERVYVV